MRIRSLFIVVALFITSVRGVVLRAQADPQVPAPDPLKQILPELFLDNISLEQAVETVRARCNANIVVSWAGLTEKGFKKYMPVKVHLWNVSGYAALNAIFSTVVDEPFDRALIITEDGVSIIAANAQVAEPGDVSIIDVRSLLDEAVSRRKIANAGRDIYPNPDYEKGESDALRKLVMSNVSADFWMDNGGKCQISIWCGRVFITGPPLLQDHVRQFLDRIRAADRPAPATQPSRNALPARPATAPSADLPQRAAH